MYHYKNYENIKNSILQAIEDFKEDSSELCFFKLGMLFYQVEAYMTECDNQEDDEEEFTETLKKGW